MVSERKAQLLAVSTLALVGACADLIGANFGEYEVEPTTASSGSTVSGTAVSTGPSASTGDGAGGLGGGGLGGGGGSTAESSSSSGVACEEWPTGSGEWKWATEVRAGEAAMTLKAVVPSSSPVFPWAGVGTYAGTVFEESEAEASSENRAPFIVALGPSGVDVDHALALACSGECRDVEIGDAASDPAGWELVEGVGFMVGQFSGTFLGQPSGKSETMFFLRFNQVETGHAFGNDAFIPSASSEAPDERGILYAIDMKDGQVGVVGNIGESFLFPVQTTGVASRFFVGVARQFPVLLERRGGRLTSGTAESSCPRVVDELHERELDVAIDGDRVWSAGWHCALGPEASIAATPPGDGFVVVQTAEVDDPGKPRPELDFDDPEEGAINFGAVATAIAAIDQHSAVVAGEVLDGDPAASLPGGEAPFDDGGSAFVAVIDEVDGVLAPRWVKQLDAPGQQHAFDVAVRRLGPDEIEVYVAGITEQPFVVDGFTSPCAFDNAAIAYVAKLDNDGEIVWIRTFGREDARPVQLRIGEEGLIVAARTGLGGYGLEPAARPLDLTLTTGSFFIGELSF